MSRDIVHSDSAAVSRDMKPILVVGRCGATWVYQ
ncbi:hypothetical protein J2S64_003690 [Paeniglutamicibacter sulfureus]|uniref:Uncharacterized protein n=1 Tax=Paeniglutamicibacter sulfureus TaxID=43666 RepID=A0ABU2BPT3_9MICC|nr:hypothetical protein [Paeniglutamicibacter sulfureus]MDR7359999.1 hypothetical protein [Paeniglutamicibacter sulfureus]